MRYFIFPFFCLFLFSCESTPEIPDNSNNDVLLMDELKKENLQLNRTIVDRDSLVNNYEKSIKIIESLKIFTLAESLGGVESLIGHPATMTHASIPKEVREKVGVTDGLIRLSLGVEDAEDLINDLEQAFQKV